MGRQVLFHMLPDDVVSFFAFVQNEAPVVVIERDSSTVGMESVRDPQLANVTLSLWNQTVLPRMTRKEVRREGGETYYRIDSALPVIEFCPCRFTTWNGSEALLQGRCYASFDQPSERMTAWFGDLEKWARKNLEKGPSRTIGGFIGRSARAWFEAGGILLPMFQPPVTEPWLKVVASQHKADVVPNRG